jgi:hypothetical protein
MAERQQEREWIEFPETFEDTIGCDMCGAHIDDPCDCFDPQEERRYRTARETPDG